MVEVKIAGYVCGKCGKKYNWEHDAEECCKKQRIDWESVEEFELKKEHLELLKNSIVRWFDCEFGAPCIDCKRPYGNSDVFDDIAEIINLDKKENYDYKEDDWKEEAQDFMEDLHRQTQIALEIILHCQTFKLGKYKKIDFGKWEYIGI